MSGVIKYEPWSYSKWVMIGAGFGGLTTAIACGIDQSLRDKSLEMVASRVGIGVTAGVISGVLEHCVYAPIINYFTKN